MTETNFSIPSFLFWTDLSQLRLACHSLCSWEWPWTSDPSASTSRALGSKACATMPSLNDAGNLHIWENTVRPGLSRVMLKHHDNSVLSMFALTVLASLLPTRETCCTSTSEEEVLPSVWKSTAAPVEVLRRIYRVLSVCSDWHPSRWGPFHSVINLPFDFAFATLTTKVQKRFFRRHVEHAELPSGNVMNTSDFSAEASSALVGR